MIWEILQWLQLANAKKTAVEINLSASNFLLVCYLLAMINNKKGRFLVTFVVCEMLSCSCILDTLNDFTYYLVFASIYCCLYHYLVMIRFKIKTIFACAIIVLFDFGASLDAVFYPQVETAFYNNYEFLAVAVHLYLISTIIDRKVLRQALGESISSVFSVLGVNYSLSLFWYTVNNHCKQKSPLCH